jgi:hypothetical protein
MTTLDHFARNVHSQFGEDGLLEAILSKLPEWNRWCVEFGAWDGRFMSNTCHLIESKDYHAVLIEGDRRKFAELKANFSNKPEVKTIQAFVGWQDNQLDDILASTDAPHDFDLLCIDVDGNDYHIWAATQSYRPKIVCIEYNPTVATGVEFVQRPDVSLSQGASITTLVALGKAKGYELVAATRNNAIFVLAHYLPLYELADNRPEVLRTDTAWVTQIFWGMDGHLFLAGNEAMPWHGIAIRRLIREIPRCLSGFPVTMPWWKRKAFAAWKKLYSLEAKTSSRKLLTRH